MSFQSDSRANDGYLIFKGSNHMKQKLILSVISGKSIRIVNIRKQQNIDGKRGLKEFEINLIRLIDKITNGTVIKLDETGTSLEFQPGLLQGGKFEHTCNVDKGIGFYLDVLLALAPFCKNSIDATLKGVTNSPDVPSVDHIKCSAFSILKKFMACDDSSLDIKIVKRGLKPLGGGEIIFKCPVKKNLKAIQMSNSGMVKRIRGVVYSCKVSPTFANRTVESSKGVMLKFLPDIYIHTDQNKGKNSGLSSGYGINLSAETTENIIYSVEAVSNSEGALVLPEDLGIQCAEKLLDEIYRGGCCDSTFQWILFLYMALGAKSVSKVTTGPLSQYSIKFLQLLREFFGVSFKLDASKDEEADENALPKVELTCVGIGYSNISKRVL
ncbi:unnamed protein product [Diamesa serratosioi]